MVAIKVAYLSLFAASLSTVTANCNVGGCIGAIVSGGLAAVGACAAAGATDGVVPPLDIGCAAAIDSTIVSTIAACAQCSVAGACTAGDQKAESAGCSQLGPNHCVQLSSSVPHPSNTDKVIGGTPSKTMHCHNKGLVIDSNGATCYWPCSNCTQCAGVPSNKRMIADIFEA